MWGQGREGGPHRNILLTCCLPPPPPPPPRQQDKEYIGSRVARLQKHAQKVAAELRARAAEVRVRKGHLG